MEDRLASKTTQLSPGIRQALNWQTGVKTITLICKQEQNKLATSKD